MFCGPDQICTIAGATSPGGLIYALGAWLPWSDTRFRTEGPEGRTGRDQSTRRVPGVPAQASTLVDYDPTGAATVAVPAGRLFRSLDVGVGGEGTHTRPASATIESAGSANVNGRVIYIVPSAANGRV